MAVMVDMEKCVSKMLKQLHINTILLTAVLLTALPSFAQTVNVSGTVTDGENETTMPGATVMLLNPSDSTFYKFGITNTTGQFSIKGAKTGPFILQISFIGYSSYYKNLELTEENKELNLGKIAMATKKELLQTVEIVDEMVPVIINGDTIEYNAGAFKVKPEDNVKDLLKKLPGVEVDKDGKVTAQGEEVKKVLIDGKDFFGDDTKIATENLPADMVKKIQVYDDESEMSKITGIDDGDRTKTINLKIKKDRKKGVFGTVTGEGGLTADNWNNIENEDGLYYGKFNINKFKDDMQLSTLGMINNTNDQGFSYRDYLNFAGGASNAMGKGGFRNMSNTTGVPIGGDENDGFTTTKAAGLNWNQDISKSARIAMSYFYNEIDKRVYQETDIQYINTGNRDFNSFEKTNQFSFSQNHRVNLKYDQDIDSTQDLIIKVDLSTAKGNQNSWSANETRTQEGIFINSTNNENQSTGTDIGGSGNLTYGKRFKKKGRSFVTTLNYGISENDKKYYLASNNNTIDSLGGLINTTINQTQNEINNNTNFSGKVSYTEPIAKGKYLEVNYRRSNNNTDYVKDFYDIVGPGNDVFNTNLSSIYLNNYTYNSYGSYLKWNTKKSNITLGGAAQQSTLDGEIENSNFKLTRIQWNFLPRFKWKYSFNKSSRIHFNYNTNVNEPSLTQLQPTLDNSDPLNLYQGNPNLQQEYRHSGNIRFMSFNQFSFTNVFATLGAVYTKNKITNSQIFNQQFIRVTTPINVASDYLFTGYAYYGTPIRAIKSKINLKLNSSYNKSILFVNTIEDNVDRITNGIDFSIENRRKEVVDASIGAEVSYTTTKYAISDAFNQNYFSTEYYAELVIDFKKDWTFSSEAFYTIYSGDEFTDNPSIPIVEATVSKRFLKGNRGLLELSVYDIFNQNVGINRTNNLNYIQDQRTRTLSRFVMLSFSYKIRRFGGKRKKKEESKID